MEIYKTNFNLRIIIIYQIIAAIIIVFIYLSDKDMDLILGTMLFVLLSLINYFISQKVTIIITIFNNRIRIHYPWSFYLKPIEYEFEKITYIIVRDKDSRGYLSRLLFHLENSIIPTKVEFNVNPREIQNVIDILREHGVKVMVDDDTGFWK